MTNTPHALPRSAPHRRLGARPARRGIAVSLIGVVATAALAGCGHIIVPGHTHIPEGVTIIGDTPQRSYPPLPPGWKSQPAIPTSQQQAQDTVIGYFKKTLAALPPGAVIDATHYLGGNTVPADDDSNTQDFEIWTDLVLPPGLDTATTIAKVGEIWQSWGWYVLERDGFRKPNRFGYAPDGYSLQIEAPSPEGYPPTLIGGSPYYPDTVPSDRSPVPKTITCPTPCR